MSADELQRATTTTRAAVTEEQTEHARASLWTALFIALIGAAALQLTVHKNTPHWVLTASLLTLAAACGAVLFEGRKRRTYPFPRLLITGTLTVLVTLAAIARLGVLTPSVMFLLVTVYYNANNDSEANALVVYILSAVGYLALSALSFSGVLPLTDSVLALARQNNRALVGFTVVIEALLFATYVMAKRSRVATLLALERLARAQRTIEEREALLFEARADLMGARQAGRLGRFSDRTVGAYRVGELLGRGGTGEVYEGVDQTGQSVAIKVMHPHLLEDGEQVARFVREAQIASALRSPHLIRVVEGGRADDGSPYVVMERLHGEDLAQLLRARPVLPLSEAVDMVSQIALGLNVAQEKGIVHRDLKPQNVFLARASDGSVTWKVLDFGIAALSESMGELTRGGAVGTPAYMSPEQTRGQPVDHRSDVFSLAAIAYRAVTGQPAFAAPDTIGAIYRVNHVQPMRPSLLSELPRDVDAVLAIALAKDPGHRFRSASTFAAALRDAARGELDEPWRGAARAILERHGWGRDDGG